MKYCVLISWLILSPAIIFSQSINRYAAVDRFVRNFPMKIEAESDMRVFAREMGNQFKSDEERLRAVYFWITDNIAYDCAGYHAGNSSIEINAILKSRKAVCAGYSMLLKFCCDLLKIECEYISGIARVDDSEIVADAEKLKANHAWNAVKLNGKWRLIDATWASGYADKNVTGFKKQRNDYYFMMPPSDFIHKHLPDSISWQLLEDTIVTKSTFNNQPLVFNGYFENHIRSAEPFVFNLRKKVNDIIIFKFYTSDTLNAVSVYSEEKADIFVDDRLQKGDGFYYFKYLVTHSGKYDLVVAPGLIKNDTEDAGMTTQKTSAALQYYLDVEGNNLPSHRKK
jgi:hypothetical protein